MSLGYRPGSRQPKGLAGPRVPGLMMAPKKPQQQQPARQELVTPFGNDEVSLDNHEFQTQDQEQIDSREESPVTIVIPNFEQYRERLQQRKEKLITQRQQRSKQPDLTLIEHKAIEAGGNVSTSQTIIAAPNLRVVDPVPILDVPPLARTPPIVTILPSTEVAVNTPESQPAIDYREEFDAKINDLTQKLEAAMSTIAKLQDAVPDAVELDKKFKDISFPIQDIALKQRQDMLDRAKMDVSIRSIQQDLVYFRKAAHNPELFQEDIRRQLKTTEESLYNLVTDKNKDVEAQINAILTQIENTTHQMYTEFKDLMQLQHNASFWSFGIVVADGAAVYKNLPPTKKVKKLTTFEDTEDCTFLEDSTLLEDIDDETEVAEEPVFYTEYAVGQKVYIVHPMIKHEDTGDIWIRTKFVADEGTVKFGYVQVYNCDRQCRIISDFSVS